MSHISERLVVHCPDREASRRVAAFAAKHRTPDGAMRITLRVPPRLFDQRRPAVERCVVATLYPLQSARDPQATYSVTWSPLRGGPLPEFAGALAVEGAALDDCFGLVVSGYYELPHSVAGLVLDAALGQRIVETSARDLLRLVAEHVENSFAHNQAAYAGHRPLAHRGDMSAPAALGYGEGGALRKMRGVKTMRSVLPRASSKYSTETTPVVPVTSYR